MSVAISSVRWEIQGGHAHMGIWSRGGKAGDIVVEARDAETVATRLIPAGSTFDVSIPGHSGWRPGRERRPA